MIKHNPWKLASLGFAIGIVVVSGTAAFDKPADAAQVTVNREALQALGMVEAANRHLWRAPKDPEGHRQKAFEAMRAASGELRKLALSTKPPPAGATVAPAAPPVAPAAKKKK